MQLIQLLAYPFLTSLRFIVAICRWNTSSQWGQWKISPVNSFTSSSYSNLFVFTLFVILKHLHFCFIKSLIVNLTNTLFYSFSNISPKFLKFRFSIITTYSTIFSSYQSIFSGIFNIKHHLSSYLFLYRAFSTIL